MIVRDDYLPDPSTLLSGENPFDLRMCVVALQRVLFSHGAEAEKTWWVRGSDAWAPVGKWTELREDGREPYYIFSDGTSGRSSSVLPTGVRPEDVSVLIIPKAVPRLLRDYFVKLVDLFDDRDADSRQWKESLKVKIPIIDGLYATDYSKSVFGAGTKSFERAVAHGQGVESALDTFAASLVESHKNFLVAAPPVGDLILTATILRLAYELRYLFSPGVTLQSILSASDTLESFLNHVVWVSFVTA
jgi:hypothetical protein